jgi:hypothetical protein
MTSVKAVAFVFRPGAPLPGVQSNWMLWAKSVITLSTGLSRASRPTSQGGLVELSGYAQSSAEADGKTLPVSKYEFANSI